MFKPPFKPINFVVMLLAFFCINGVIGAAAAQTRQQPPVIIETDKRRDDDTPFNHIEEEMKAKRAIKYAEKEYQENLDRARDLCDLSTAVVNSYKAKNSLTHDDLKKLEKIEKLAKGIRRAAGGSEDDTDMEKPPRDIPTAIGRLGDLSQSLKAKVEKTPKHVISATVIDEANVLLEVIRIVRTLTGKV